MAAVYRIKIISYGKSKEPWLQDALAEYEKRLTSTASISWILAKSEAELEENLNREESFIALDPKGKLFSSEQFSLFLIKTLEEKKSRLTFAIGGPDGFSAKSRAKASHFLSLSPLTFTHQITRLLLLEQIYRAFEITRGSSYHK